MPGNSQSPGTLSGSAETPKSEMLCRLQRGEITLGEYLDHRAEEAVEHLKGLVDPERLKFIQSMIRDQMTSDPVLIQYLKQATGINPEGYQAS
jgi:hypothetical protein